MWQNSIPIHDYKWKNSQFLSSSVEKIPVLPHRVLFPISLLFYSHHFHFGHQMYGGFSPITKEFSWSSNTFATWCKQPTRWKRPWHWERLRARGEGGNRRWDGWIASLLSRHEIEQTTGDSEGQGSLVCCSPWGHKESDTTEWVNWTEYIF